MFGRNAFRDRDERHEFDAAIIEALDNIHEIVTICDEVKSADDARELANKLDHLGTTVLIGVLKASASLRAVPGSLGS